MTTTVLTDEQIRAEKYNVGVISPDQFFNKVARSIEQAVLQSPEVQAWKRDAERYRVLRDADYQMLEDDPCVTDDSFNTFFGVDLDKCVDALKSRRDAAMGKQP